MVLCVTDSCLLGLPTNRVLVPGVLVRVFARVCVYASLLSFEWGWVGVFLYGAVCVCVWWSLPRFEPAVCFGWCTFEQKSHWQLTSVSLPDSHVCRQWIKRYSSAIDRWWPYWSEPRKQSASHGTIPAFRWEKTNLGKSPRSFVTHGPFALIYIHETLPLGRELGCGWFGGGCW